MKIRQHFFILIITFRLACAEVEAGAVSLGLNQKVPDLFTIDALTKSLVSSEWFAWNSRTSDKFWINLNFL